MTTKEMLRDCDVILASGSPRRKELMQLITPNFRVIPADCDETLEEGTDPFKAAQILAERKCGCIADVYRSALVIGCDTVVICDGRILGKPRDEEDAAQMLRLLSGKTHQVVTGVSIKGCCGEESFSAVTDVTFRELSEEDIGDYVATGEPMDKAGAYGIQGEGALLAEGIRGDFFNVVGLPVSELAVRLRKRKEEGKSG